LKSLETKIPSLRQRPTFTIEKLRKLHFSSGSEEDEHSVNFIGVAHDKTKFRQPLKEKSLDETLWRIKRERALKANEEKKQSK